VQREPPSVVRSRSFVLSLSLSASSWGARSFSLSLSLSLCVFLRRSFVLVRSFSLSLFLCVFCGAASARTRKVRSRHLWSCARGGCGLCLLGARLSSGNSMVSMHAFLYFAEIGFFNNTTIELTRRSRDIHERGAPLLKFCSPEDPPFTPLP